MYSTIQFLLKTTISVGWNLMIPPHLFYQIYPSFLEQNDCTPPKCGELSEYTDSAHTEVEDLSSRCMNGKNKTKKQSMNGKKNKKTKQKNTKKTALCPLQRGLETAGYRAKRRIKRPLLTPAHKAAHLAWCQVRHRWNLASVIGSMKADFFCT